MAREMYLVGVDESDLQPPAPPQAPKTPKGKWDNYWYHYKWVTLGSLAAAVVLTVLIVQMVTKPRYDYTLLIVTKNSAMSDMGGAVLETQLEKYGLDLNGDGKVLISVQLIPLGGDSMLASTNNTKLVTMIGAGEAMFCAFDPAAYEDRILNAIESTENGAKFFDTLGLDAPGVSTDGVYWNWKDDAIHDDEVIAPGLPDELYFGVRRAVGTAAGSNQQQEHDNCLALLKAFITKTPLTPTKTTSAH